LADDEKFLFVYSSHGYQAQCCGTHFLFERDFRKNESRGHQAGAAHRTLGRVPISRGTAQSTPLCGSILIFAKVLLKKIQIVVGKDATKKWQ
jgi:hypothetical protein